MITVLILLVVWAAVLVVALRLNAAVTVAADRFRVLTASYSEAELLAGARQRFRRRQAAVEQVVATGTSGMEFAHRSIARHFGVSGTGAEVYQRVRGFNRGFGRALSTLFAPGPRKRSGSLDEWRARKAGPPSPEGSSGNDDESPDR